MSKVKLLSNLQSEQGVIAEGSVVDLPDEQAEHLVKLGAAVSTDEPVGEAKAKEEVEPATDPLVSTLQDGDTPESPKAPDTPAPSTTDTPVSSSPDLHLS